MFSDSASGKSPQVSPADEGNNAFTGLFFG